MGKRERADDSARSGTLDVSDRRGLHQALDEVAANGWECPSGDAILGYTRSRVVAPLVAGLHLTGASATEAEAVGWVAGWQALARPTIREAQSPWGVVRAAARAAVLGELLAAQYGTNVRRAWRLARLHRATTEAVTNAGRDSLGADAEWLEGVDPRLAAPPTSLTALMEAGWEAQAGPVEPAEALGPRLSRIVEVLGDAGWTRDRAAAAVAWVASNAAIRDGEVRGWRPMAAQLGIPAWQARRLVLVLLGSAGRPGLVERLVRDGDHVLDDHATRRSLRSTTARWLPSPGSVSSAAAADRAAPDNAVA